MRDTGTQQAQDRGLPTRPRDEIARLGDQIYERDIRPQVEAAHRGEIVSIDVDTGSWALGGTLLAAADRLRAQRPDAVNVWSLRVGVRAVYAFGGGLRRINETTPMRLRWLRAESYASNALSSHDSARPAGQAILTVFGGM